MKWCIPLAALAGLLLSLNAQAETQKLTLLVTGDNRGEVNHCGCSNKPLGGLSRRKVVIDQARAKGPTLALDAGNALFKNLANTDEAKKRAEFILKTMGELGTSAMAVGMWDLAAGPDFLKGAAKKANMKLVSANLAVKGKLVFEPSVVLKQGETRIGVVAVGPDVNNPDFPGLQGLPPVPAALAEAKKLKGKVDVVIVLAAIEADQAAQLAREAGDSVDLVLQSGDMRQPTVPRKEGSALFLSTGRRGQTVARVELDLSGQGPLVDLGQLAREEQSLALLEQQAVEARKRQAAARDEAQRKGYEETLKSFEARKAQVQASIASLRDLPGRKLLLSTVQLGPEVADDPVLKAKVDQVEPPGSVKENRP